MRPFSLLAAAALAAVTLAEPASFKNRVLYSGKAIVKNQCDFPLYLWSVDDYSAPADGDAVVVPPHAEWSEPLRVPRKGCNCGVSIKLSKTKTKARPILQFEYTVAQQAKNSDSFICYDISFVDCSTYLPGVAAVDGYTAFSGTQCPSWNEGIEIYGSGNCPKMTCPPGQFCPYDAYFEPEPKALHGASPVRQCPNGDLSSDVILVACSGKGYSGSPTSSKSNGQEVKVNVENYSPPPPPPPPTSSTVPTTTTTSTPVITKPPKTYHTKVQVDNVVVYTTVVQTVYVDQKGNRINEDGTPYLGRRFLA